MKKAMLLACALLAPAAGAQEWVDVFNGKDLTGLKLYGSGSATPKNGVLQVSGGNGYLATLKTYRHFRTRVEWNNSGGNSGMLFHIQKDRVWPLGLECQMASGDVGSLWTTGCKFNSTGSGSNYNETGAAITGFGTTGTSRNHFVKAGGASAPDNAWNTWEMYVKGDSLEIKVNDKAVMRVWKITVSDGTPLDSGRVGLQIEGADVQWRNWKIQDLSGSTIIAPLRRAAGGKPARLRFDPVLGILTAFGEGQIPRSLDGRELPPVITSAISR